MIQLLKHYDFNGAFYGSEVHTRQSFTIAFYRSREVKTLLDDAWALASAAASDIQ